MKYKISIVIPTFNLENHLENTLNSLIKQTIGIENLEVIMVDDCSTDGTPDIVDNYSNQYDNFISIHLTDNSGLPGKPRNIGLEKATGEYVMFMDHDDYYAPDACEVLYSKITSENADMVFCNFLFVFDDSSEKNISIYRDKDEIKIDRIDDDPKMLALSPAIWTKIFRRSFVTKNRIKFPVGILAEDLSFYIHSLLKANGIIFLNNYYGYNYRIRDSADDKSTIHIRNKKYLKAMLDGYYDTYNILKQEQKENYFPIVFQGNLEYWLNCFATGNTTKTGKIELLQDAGFLFEKQAEYGFEADETVLSLFQQIKNKEYESAILISDIISIFRKKEITYNKNYRRLLREFEAIKLQVAELQTIKGYLKYKTKNFSSRLKRKI